MVKRGVINISARGLLTPILWTSLLCLACIPFVINSNVPVFSFTVFFILLIFSGSLFIEKNKIAKNKLLKGFKAYFIYFFAASIFCFLLFGFIFKEAAVLYFLISFLFTFVLPVSFLAANCNGDRVNGSIPLKTTVFYTIGITFISFTSLGIHTSIIDQPLWLIILQFIALASLNTFNWIMTLNFAAQNRALIVLGIPPSLYINTEEDESKTPAYSEYPEKEKNSNSRDAFIQLSEKISTIETEINKNVTTLKKSYEEQSTGLKKLVASLSEMRRNTRENNRHAQFAKKISQNAVLMVDEMTRNSIESLEFIEQISQKINIVTDIARQTRFLSLNASVEAARAGEQGKGFAIIAEEIKKLSDNSRKAADEMIKLSEATVTSTEKTKKTAENLAPEVQNSSALLEDTATGTKELAGNFKELVTFIQSLEGETQNIKEEAETAMSNVELLNKLSYLFREEIEDDENQEHFSDEYSVSWS